MCVRGVSYVAAYVTRIHLVGIPALTVSERDTPEPYPLAMALTAKQRNALPNSAFAYPSKRAYPVPTKAQAKRAGISEVQRQRTHRAALSMSAKRRTSGSYRHVSSKVAKRR